MYVYSVFHGEKILCINDPAALTAAGRLRGTS